MTSPSLLVTLPGHCCDQVGTNVSDITQREPVYTLCLKKLHTSKSGRHKFIKISSPVCPNDFSHKAPPFSCRLIELEKFSTGRVPAARFSWQPGTLADDSYVNKQNEFDRRGQYFDQKFVLVKRIWC